MLHLIPISNGQLVSVYWKKLVIPTILSLTVLLLSIGDCWAQGTLRDGGTYTIRNIQNEKLLTVADQGIVGLLPGLVITAEDRPESLEQAWTVKWEPLPTHDLQGYWLYSKKDFLNAVTSWYPPGRSTSVINIWRLAYLGTGKWQIRNMRSNRCLQIAKNGIDILEGKCSTKDKGQQWSFTRIIKYPIEDDEQHIIFTFRKAAQKL